MSDVQIDQGARGGEVVSNDLKERQKRISPLGKAHSFQAVVA